MCVYIYRGRERDFIHTHKHTTHERAMLHKNSYGYRFWRYRANQSPMHWEQPLKPSSLALHLAQSLAAARVASMVAGSSWLALALLELGFGSGAGAFGTGLVPLALALGPLALALGRPQLPPCSPGASGGSRCPAQSCWLVAGMGWVAGLATGAPASQRTRGTGRRRTNRPAGTIEVGSSWQAAGGLSLARACR